MKLWKWTTIAFFWELQRQSSLNFLEKKLQLLQMEFSTL